ncbi:methionyl-tRNA formyltransferase [Winogradskyella sp. DF17]|uniref:Methionyl-tRNA formyltransferase n=1 Tax=Winogradskyella pelagia TaxID=2819984 RepID=A0ABS3T1F8_9FLAO|nr:methionyl-tRNA formyltransferase [Winogradskyella sp. DF17]MBO3116580.1 methionyl-tRNA formyltransferase [Winogradskyella sp. DF17]
MTKSRHLRIVFMGTPDFAVESLRALISNNYNVVGVITAPDKPAGRGQKLRTSAVKAFALQHNLPVLQPTNLKDDEFIETLRSLNANLQVVVAFRMLPKVVWQMPAYGTFNLHASLLPQYRGAAPIHWAIINGETKTGATTFFIDEKIDTGAIIDSAELPIGKDETVGSLHDKLMHLGAQLVVDTVHLIEKDKVSTSIQPKLGALKTAYKLNRENCKIDWSQPLDEVYNKIRGLNPFPAAWCYLNNDEDEELMIKVFDVKKEKLDHNHASGTVVVSSSTLKIACRGGFIEILKIQLPGKRKMDTKSLLNGFQFSKNAKLL